MAMQAAIGSLGNISIASLKNSFDEVRAVVYPKNETERKVYEALSSKNWGASTTLMNDIAGDTGDYEKFGIIMTLIWASIETDGKSWKQVFKALTLIDFLVKNGSERVIEACRDKVYKIRSLENFNFYEGALDRGSGVREKSKMIVELLGSNEMIRTEREKASNLRNKFVGIGNDGSRGSTGSTSTGSSYSGGGGGGGYGNSSDRGFGNSYSDSHSSSNGGGHDNYSSNNSGRQIHDSYDSNRGGGGGGSGSNSNSNGRYRDDEVRFPSETVAAPRKSYDEDDTEVKIKHKPKVASKISAPSVDSAVGGKLKLTIKKGTTSSAAASAPSAVPVPQPSMLDFMDAGDADFMTAPTISAVPQASSNAIMFDAFSTPAATVQDDFGFASFNIAPPVPAPQAAFDPFGMGSSPAQAPSAPVIQFSPAPFQQAPAAPQQSFGQFNSPQQAPPVPQAPMMQSGLLSMQAPMAPQQQQQSFNQYASPIQSPPVPSIPAMQPAMQQQQYSQQPQQYQPQQQQQQQQPVMQQQQQQQQQLPMGGYGAPPAPAPTPQVFRGIVAKAPEPPASFGDFEGSTQGPAAQGNGKWGDIAGLVNLGGISKNESVQAKKQAAIAAVSNYTPSSFSGLDGFSKSQSMQQNSTPMNMMRQAPMQQQPAMNVMGGGGGGGGGGFNMMQGQGQGQGQGPGQFQNYGNGIPPGGQMAPNRGMAMAPPQQQQQQGQGQGQYGGGMQGQGQQGAPMGMGGGMGMGMGMGMQGSGPGAAMGGQGQGYGQGQGQGQGQAPNVPAYGYPAQGQNGSFY